MTCLCDLFEPLVLRRVDVASRIRETPQIRTSFTLVAADEASVARLYRCAACDQLWQSGLHASFGSREYVFQVPEISREAWLSERWCDPAELIVYAEEKRRLSELRHLGVSTSVHAPLRVAPPSGRLFFLSPEALVESRRPVSACYEHLDEGAAPRPDAQHLESVRAAS